MSSSVVHVSEIVKVLVNDELVVKERVHFVSYLGTPPTERIKWEALYVMDISTGFEHFTKLIEEWVQRTTPTPSLGQLREILKSCGFKPAIDSLASFGDDDAIIKINQSSASTSPGTNGKAISSGVLQPTTYFLGRDDELQQLSQLFYNQCPPKVVVISGIGGQGKTELCRQFIKTLKDKISPPAFTWLGGDNATNLTSSIVQLAQSLQIPTTTESKPIPLTQLIVQVADNISASSSGWLVVIDNVDEVYSEFKQVVPLLVRHGSFVLVTTRKIDILTGGSKQIKLGVMKDDDAHNLIRKCLNQPPIEEDAHNLCHALGNHVLALRQAVAYINAQQVENRTSYNINDYLNDFAKDMTLLNDQDHFVEDYDQTIFLIVTRTIKTIHDKHGRLGRKAAGLMEILCLILPDGISVECLQKFYNILETTKTQKWYQKLFNPFRANTEGIDQALQLLKKYSLINLDNGFSLSIHRLLQKVAKCHSGGEANRLILKTIEPLKCSKEELQQAVHFWEQADTETVKKLPKLSRRIFFRMHQLSLVLEMRPFAEKNLQLLTKLFGPNDENTLDMEYNLAFALFKNGDYEAALTKFEQVLKKNKQVLGVDNPSTLGTASQMAGVFYKLNRFEEALEYNEQVLEAQLRVLGSNHEDTMGTRHNMASVLKKLGRIDEAWNLYSQVLEWAVSNLGHSHPDTLNTRDSIAVMLLDQGQLEEAKTELETVLNLSEEFVGVEHTQTLGTKGWLATTLWELGRREEALTMNREVLTSREKVLGANHPDTISTRNQITQWSTELES